MAEVGSEFSQLNLAEDEIIKSIYAMKNSSDSFPSKMSSTKIIRSDGGNLKEDSVANPNLDVPTPQVKTEYT